MLVLSVSSLKGGVGKTSVTLGLASAAYSRGIPTLVIDMDPQADASTGLDIPIRTDVDIADVLAAPKKRVLDSAVVPSGWVGDKKGHIDVISGSPRAAEFDQPTLSMRYLRRLSEAIHKAGAGYRLVLIDCPPSLNGLTRAAWTASNRVLIVTEPGLFSVAAADRALRASDELRRRTGTDLQPLGIVVNRARLQSREHSYRIDELREMFGPLVINPPIPERTVLQQAQGSARPIHSWPGKPAAELAAGFDKILDRALRSERMRRRTRPAADAAGSTDSETVEPKGTAAQPAAQDDASTAAHTAGASGAGATAAGSQRTDGSSSRTPSRGGGQNAPGAERDADSRAEQHPADQNGDQNRVDQSREGQRREGQRAGSGRAAAPPQPPARPTSPPQLDERADGSASAPQLRRRRAEPTPAEDHAAGSAEGPETLALPLVDLHRPGAQDSRSSRTSPSSTAAGSASAQRGSGPTGSGETGNGPASSSDEPPLTRRQLREREEQEKNAKKQKWFGR